VSAPRVKIPLGGLKGYYKVSQNGRKYEAYEGIPYALPPIGKLRFKVQINDIISLKLHFLKQQFLRKKTEVDFYNKYQYCSSKFDLFFLWQRHNSHFLINSRSLNPNPSQRKMPITSSFRDKSSNMGQKLRNSK